MKRRIGEAVLGLVVGGALLWWVLQDFDWRLLGSVLRKGMGSLLLAGLFMSGAHLIRAWRWQLMLQSSQINIDLAAPWWALMIGYLVNIALPRVGEVVRCSLLWRWRGVSFPIAIGTVVAERLMDVLILLGLASTVIVVEGTAWLKAIGWDAYTVYFVIAAVIGGIISLGILRYLLRRHTFPWMRAALQGFESLWRTRPRWVMITSSLSIWLGYGGAVWGVMEAYDPSAGNLFWSAWVLLVGSGLAMAIPVPGGIGTFHAIGLILLSGLGWKESEAKVVVFAAHALQTLLVIILGSLGLIWGSWQAKRA
ncbi:MAG: flippase-like domain-containing protein [Bacteroidia bacterium]|nr:flippase-like domain-containing protein [Bacteroidia bacterium]MDW8057592.1 lysylphosphatidylglycerol synthase transmembrane domain-containing protein [Bacteroidia bacterium]